MISQQLFWIYEFVKEEGHIEDKSINDIIHFIHSIFDVAVTKEQIEELELNYKKYKSLYASKKT